MNQDIDHITDHIQNSIQNSIPDSMPDGMPDGAATPNTDKKLCRQLAALLAQHGVRRVFLSPGSRNAPLIVAVSRCPRLETTVVVDERSAAFMALGYASASDTPVALVCTSGTALLNYAPAVAEAYYRRIPLIVVSADRPAEWIDQDDSQTLRQSGALANYVKLSVDIPETTTPNLAWYGNRVINDALIAAQTGRKAPVHINIQLDAPLGRIVDTRDPRPRSISVTLPREDVDTQALAGLYDRYIKSPRRVMVIAGFLAPDAKLNDALARMARWDNVVVLTETISNLHSPDFVSRIDTTLSAMDSALKSALAPDLVITLGGALVSRFVKEYIRALSGVEHWHVGVSHTTIDCFQHLTRRVEIDPGIFFSQISQIHDSHQDTDGGTAARSDYRDRWMEVAAEADRRHDAYIDGLPWSDMTAFATFMPLIPPGWRLQWSNGTPIRYAQLFGRYTFARSDCNRGVSGIDGCTSTAIGAAMAVPTDTTLLVTGDMSAQYDVGAFASVGLAPNFKAVVMCNGGGAIFRFIPQTSALPELDRYFAVAPPVPVRAWAEGYGMAYFQAADQNQLREVFPAFVAHSGSPAVLAIHTPVRESAEILKRYFQHQNKSR